MPTLSQQTTPAGTTEQQSPTTPTPTPTGANYDVTKRDSGLAPHPSQLPPREQIVRPQQGETIVVADWPKASAYLIQVRAFYMQFAGKVGCNPYMYLTKKVLPLELLYQDLVKTFDYGTEASGLPTTKEQYEGRLYNAIMSLEMKQSYAMHDPEAHGQEKVRQQGVDQARAQGQKQILFN